MANHSDLVFAGHLFNRGSQQPSYHYPPPPHTVPAGEYGGYPIYALHHRAGFYFACSRIAVWTAVWPERSSFK